MSKFTAFLLFVFVVAAGYLALYNREMVDIYLSENIFYSVSKIVLMLISFGVGALFVFTIYAVRDTKRLFNRVQTKRRQKKQQKLSRLYQQALVAINAGKEQQAISLLNDIIKEEETNWNALTKLGELYMKRGDLGEAEDYFKKALSIDGDSAFVLLQLAEIKIKKGNLEEALDLVNKVLTEDTQNHRAIYKKSEILDSLSRWEELVELYRELIKKTKEETKKRPLEEKLRGYSFEMYREAMQKGEFDRAAKGFKSLLKQDDAFIPAHLGMAEVMLRENREDEAISYLEDVFRRQSSVILIARLEELLLKKGDPSRIINLYQDALSSGDDSIMKFFLAKLYFRLEMLDDALETLDSIEDQSLSEEIARIRGMIYHKRGQFDMAAQQFINTFSIGSILKIPYCCSNCKFISANYSGRCPSCKRWNTFTFNIYGTCKVETARSSPQQ